MTTEVFLFKNVHVESIKVSHNLMIGLPSLTGITGMAANFASKVSQALDLEPEEIVSSGVLFAFEDYQLIDGYKKGYKQAYVGGQLKGSAVYEALPAAFANLTIHVAFELTAVTERASQVLSGDGTNKMAQAILSEMNFCKGRMANVPLPVNLHSPKLAELGGLRARAVAMLPSFSTVMVEASEIVQNLRDEGFPLMEGLIAATLPHPLRPQLYQRFFEAESRGAGIWKLAAVQDGFLVVDAEGVGQATRPHYSGEQGVSHVASATLGLVRLQSAASLKISIAGPGHELVDADTGEIQHRSVPEPFWTMKTTPGSYYCTTA